jgi:hypothetical protein
MPDTTSEDQAVRDVLQSYIDGIRLAEGENMRLAFHPDASMSRVSAGKIVISINPGESIGKYMSARPPTLETSPDYRGEIVRVDLFGDMAAAWVREYSLEGLNFDTLLHLHKAGDRWVITAKATRGVPVGS